MQDDGFADLGYFFTLTNLELLNLDASDVIRRVLRGGSFGYRVRCAARGDIGAGSRDDHYGFRVVVSPFVFSER